MFKHLFNKQKPAPEVIVKEVPCTSRFTFAHDDVPVDQYVFVADNQSSYGSINANEVFTTVVPLCFNEHTTGNEVAYPIFKMPKLMPTTKLISPKRVVCLGCMIVDAVTDEIIRIDWSYAGMTMEEVCGTAITLTEADIVFKMITSEVIKQVQINGDITEQVYARYICIKDALQYITMTE